MDNNLHGHFIRKDAALPFSLPAWIALAPYEEYLGMSIVETAAGKATLSMPFRAIHCQGAGLMHGGAVVSLADTALAIAIKTLLPEGTDFVTMEMNLQFHAPVRWGTVQAVAVVTGQSEKKITGEVTILTEYAIKAATFHAVFRIRQGRTAN